MAKASGVLDGGPGRIEALASAIGGQQARHPAPPLHLWNPPFCGDIDMRIARDGTWFYGGTPIARPALVRLFASVLRREEGRYVLVTPVEKVGIVVEDAPFVAVEMTRDAEVSIMLRTSLDDWLTLGPDHPLRFDPGPADSLKPYARLRGDLWALVARPLFYDLMEAGEIRAIDGTDMFGIGSDGAFFPMMAAADIDGLVADSGLG